MFWPGQGLAAIIVQRGDAVAVTIIGIAPRFYNRTFAASITPYNG